MQAATQTRRVACVGCVFVSARGSVHGSVSGIKKPSHRQSPAVNETGPDVGARGG